MGVLEVDYGPQKDHAGTIVGDAPACRPTNMRPGTNTPAGVAAVVVNLRKREDRNADDDFSEWYQFQKRIDSTTSNDTRGLWELALPSFFSRKTVDLHLGVQTYQLEMVTRDLYFCSVEQLLLATTRTEAENSIDGPGALAFRALKSPLPTPDSGSTIESVPEDDMKENFAKTMSSVEGRKQWVSQLIRQLWILQRELFIRAYEERRKSGGSLEFADIKVEIPRLKNIMLRDVSLDAKSVAIGSLVVIPGRNSFNRKAPVSEEENVGEPQETSNKTFNLEMLCTEMVRLARMIGLIFRSYSNFSDQAGSPLSHFNAVRERINQRIRGSSRFLPPGNAKL